MADGLALESRVSYNFIGSLGVPSINEDFREACSELIIFFDLLADFAEDGTIEQGRAILELTGD
jgi:hypothetical protein